MQKCVKRSVLLRINISMLLNRYLTADSLINLKNMNLKPKEKAVVFRSAIVARPARSV